MKCFRCNSPLEVHVGSAKVEIPKHESGDNLTIDLRQAFQLQSDDDEPIKVVCSKDPTHKQISSTESKLKFAVAQAFSMAFRTLAQKYYC